MPSICRRRAVQTVAHMPSMLQARVQQGHTLRQDFSISAGAGQHNCWSTAGQSADSLEYLLDVQHLQAGQQVCGLLSGTRQLGTLQAEGGSDAVRHQWPGPVGRAG